MSLEKEQKWYVVTHGHSQSYAATVHTESCSYVPRMRNAHVWTRNPLDEKGLGGNYYPCQRCKPTASPETIAAQKAKLTLQLATTEAAAREREQAREEKRLRLREVFRCVRGWGNTELLEDRITFMLDGHRYEIREVED